MTCIKEKRYECFEKLFRDNYTRLYFYTLNFINDQACAEDIVEDTFSYLWENYEDIVNDNSPVPLLYSLIHNRCIDHLRHLEVRNKYETTLLQSPESWEEEDDGNTMHQERVDKIMMAVEELPPQTRKVFESCFLQGKKYKEVGEELNISINTVKTHISRALAYIRGKT